MSYCDGMTESLETRPSKRIDRNRSDVFLRANFADLSSYYQVSRAVREIVRQGRLMTIG